MSAQAQTRRRARQAPDFYIVGHPKSGTTALYRMLASHPALYMPRKEPSYFVPELLQSNNKLHVADKEEYLALYDGAAPEQLTGEATPAYLWSTTAASRIAEERPDARIIAVLREPTSFLRSLHMQFIHSNVETEPDLGKAIALEQERREGRRIPRNSTRRNQLVYSDHVNYVEQLRRYHAVFPAEQVLVLIYEDFRADNEAAVRQILRFLDVDVTAPLSLVETNVSTAVRSPRLHDALRALYLGRRPAPRAAKRMIMALTPQRLRHRTINSAHRLQHAPPPPVDEQLMLELRRRFAPEVVALSEYLGRDLVGFWGYDRLD